MKRCTLVALVFAAALGGCASEQMKADYRKAQADRYLAQKQGRYVELEVRRNEYDYLARKHSKYR